MDNNSIEVFENLPTFEMSLPIEVKETMVYIAGYIVRKDESTESTKNCRRGLAKPNDTSCQFVFFGYILFREIMHDVCKKTLCSNLMVIAEFFKC